MVDAALQARLRSDTEVMLARGASWRYSPAGRPLDDALVDELAAESALTLLCGRYEGVDQRVREHLANDAISVGPYVLSGGELAAMVVTDAVMRKLPGVLGDERQCGGGVVLGGARGRPRVSAVHPAGGIPRLGGPGGAALRASRTSA